MRRHLESKPVHRESEGVLGEVSSLPAAREYECSVIRLREFGELPEQRHRLLWKRQRVLPPGFHPLRRNRPRRGLEIDLRPPPCTQGRVTEPGVEHQEQPRPGNRLDLALGQLAQEGTYLRHLERGEVGNLRLLEEAG